MRHSEIQLFLKLVDITRDESEEENVQYKPKPIEVPAFNLLNKHYGLIDNTEWLTLTPKGKQYLDMLEGTPLPNSKTVWFDPRFKE